MEAPKELYEMWITMKENDLSKEAAYKILTYISRPDQFKEMTQYIRHWSDIITDHQAVQHARKIQRREWLAQENKD